MYIYIYRERERESERERVVCKLCLHTEMMNCSGAINVSVSYYIYRTLVRLRHLEVLK